MIFSPSAISLIESGKKTATTRRSKRPWLIKPIQAIQPGRGKKGVGFIKICSVERITIDPDHSDFAGLGAQLRLSKHAEEHYSEEGFDDPGDLYVRFLELKLHKILAKQGVLYYYEFEYVGKSLAIPREPGFRAGSASVLPEGSKPSRKEA
jgi:hypothetical protein